MIGGSSANASSKLNLLPVGMINEHAYCPCLRNRVLIAKVGQPKAILI